MTPTAQQVITEFKTLSAEEQKMVLCDLLRMPLELPDITMTDDELRHAADALFLELDQREMPL